jgi:hypothetical protein
VLFYSQSRVIASTHVSQYHKPAGKKLATSTAAALHGTAGVSGNILLQTTTASNKGAQIQQHTLGLGHCLEPGILYQTAASGSTDTSLAAHQEQTIKLW